MRICPLDADTLLRRASSVRVVAAGQNVSSPRVGRWTQTMVTLYTGRILERCRTHESKAQAQVEVVAEKKEHERRRGS